MEVEREKEEGGKGEGGGELKNRGGDVGERRRREGGWGD
jgi:hypothetical protein